MRAYLLLVALLACLMIGVVCGAEEKASLTVAPAAFSEEEMARQLIGKLRGNVRGAGATCRFVNTDLLTKTFICDVSYEKKLVLKKIKVSGTVTMVAYLTRQKVQLKVETGGKTLFDKEFDMGLVNLDPICLDFLFDIGFCVQVRNIRFDIKGEGCAAFDIEGYFNAFGFRETVLKQPLGYNVNKC